jgi:hypothetical protein
VCVCVCVCVCMCVADTSDVCSRWVEDESGGRGGGTWCERYVNDWVNIGGPLLGVPKAAATLLSGEMQNTARFTAVEELLMDSIFSPLQRFRMFRSWPSLASMLPKGECLRNLAQCAVVCVDIEHILCRRL